MKFILIAVFLFLASCTSTQHRRDTRPTTGRTTAPTTPKRGTTPTAPGLPTQTLPSEAQKAVELERKGNYLEALQEYVNLSVSASTPAAQESYRLKALDILETRLDEGSLSKVSGDSNFGFLRGHALYQLGRMSLDRRDTDQARKYFSSVVSFLPGSDLAFQADEILAQLESVKYVEPKTIGVVLPLSGKNAAVGQKALRGIEMGLGLNEANSNFKLAVMDSEGNPDNARRGVERLVKEDNVIAIVGSLLSRTAPAVAAKANELGVPTLAMSQKAGVTEVGPSVFRNALTSEMQVRQLVRSAIDDLKMRRFAILYPNDAYGTEYANIFWDEVLARGGTITAAQPYNPKENDFRAPVQRLVGTFYVEGRDDEFKMIQRDSKKPEQKKKTSIRQEKSADDVLPAVVDFDAIFIPDSAKIMNQMAAFLSYAGVRNVKLLGTNLWNMPGTAKKAGLFADHIVFVDSTMGDADESRQPKFVKDYKQLFKETPSLIEIQAYDSALILRSLILQGASSREELTRRLTDLKKFPGALGTLEMSSQREIRRPLMTFTTSGGNPVPMRNTY